jgi:hypothetical protein
MEAEYVTLTHAGTKVHWFHNLYMELGFPLWSTITVREDNLEAVLMANNPFITQKSQLLCPLAYLWCHVLTCTYILLPCVPLDHFYQTCLSIRDSMDFAVISILSSYFLSHVTVLTFLISLVSHARAAPHTQSHLHCILYVWVSSYSLLTIPSATITVLYCVSVSSLLSSLCIVSSLYDSDYSTCI